MMNSMPNGENLADLPEEIRRRKRVITGELRERTLWFVKLRWWVPPSIAAGSIAAHLIGVEFSMVALLLTACFIMAYNVVFHIVSGKIRETPRSEIEFIRRFTYWQVALDYAAMFLLIHFTGGAASPFIFFFIFHIIFASILLPPRWAYGFAGLAAAGMILIAAFEYMDWIVHNDLTFQGAHIDLAYQPFHMMVELGFFTASVFITAFSVTSIMRMLRKRIVDLADLSETITNLNNKLQALYSMVQAIGSTRSLGRVLDIVTGELALVMGVKAISVKLLSDDGKQLKYAASYGLPEEFASGAKTVEVDKSPLNRMIIEGEPFITGHVTEREMFQFGEDLAKARLKSVLLVPLIFEERVTGILGAYCETPDRFNEEHVHFFRLAAGLVAIALENAKAYESIENLINERSRFMMRVAHNLRAPLAAMLSILEVVRGGYKGELNDDQREYLRRVDRRARTMISLINELMTLSQNRNIGREFSRRPVDLLILTGRLQRTFQDEAAEKKVVFKIEAPDDMPGITGNPDMIEQMIENLVSNAIKYTPSGGHVDLRLSVASDCVRIEVSDNGIGVPRDDRPKLFTEFFRARNAREVDEIGTGLGLTIVKDIVDKHGGKIIVESEEGLGTIFVVHLPIPPKEKCR